MALGLVNVLGDDLSVLGKFSEANRQANTYSSGPGVTLKSSLWPIEPKKNSKKYRLAAAGWNQSTNARCQIHGQLKSILWFFWCFFSRAVWNHTLPQTFAGSIVVLDSCLGLQVKALCWSLSRAGSFPSDTSQFIDKAIRSQNGRMWRTGKWLSLRYLIQYGLQAPLTMHCGSTPPNYFAAALAPPKPQVANCVNRNIISPYPNPSATHSITQWSGRTLCILELVSADILALASATLPTFFLLTLNLLCTAYALLF